MAGRSRQLLKFLLRFWPVGRLLNWAGRQPPFERLLRPWFDQSSNHAVMIPVQAVIEGTRSAVLPYLILRPLVEQAQERRILAECLCRVAENCQEHPHEIGCLFLGEGASRIHPSLGRPANAEEALAHLDRAMQAGLAPLIVHSAFDAMILGIPYRKMLAVCFCCDCCCTVRSGLRMGPRAFWDTVERLPGLRLEVTQACKGCGRCLPVCPVAAITLEDGRARIGEQCKGCGRCAAACPRGAIQLLGENIPGLPDFVQARVSERTEI